MFENILKKIEALPPLPQTIIEIEAFRKSTNKEIDNLIKIIEKAQGQRAQGNCVLLVTMNKNKKFQKEQLQKEGYLEFVEFYADHFEE